MRGSDETIRNLEIHVLGEQQAGITQEGDLTMVHQVPRDGDKGILPQQRYLQAK